MFRSVALLSPLELDEDIRLFYAEHVEGEIHDHDAVDLVSRGSEEFKSFVHYLY